MTEMEESMTDDADEPSRRGKGKGSGYTSVPRRRYDKLEDVCELTQRATIRTLATSEQLADSPS